MKRIHVSEDIRLTEGFEEFVIESDRDLDLSVSASGKCLAACSRIAANDSSGSLR